MKFNPNSIIEGCVSTDATRLVLNNVQLDTKDEGAPKLIATNGRMMAIIPCEVEEGDTAGQVSPDAIKAARKLSGKKLDAQLKANGTLAIPNGQSFPRPEFDFPNWRQVVVEPGQRYKVAFDAEYLLRLAKALSKGDSTIVTLSFDGPTEPIHVTGSLPGAVGILMPCKCSAL